MPWRCASRGDETIGIIGGLSAESAAEYYLTIARTHQARRRDDYYPEVVMHSVCFGRWTDWARAGDWDAVGEALVASAQRLAAAGAELGVIASNTMHLGFAWSAGPRSRSSRSSSRSSRWWLAPCFGAAWRRRRSQARASR